MTERHALPRFLGPALAPLACVAFCVTAGSLSIVGGLVLVGGYIAKHRRRAKWGRE
jgi:hypothetical protein